MPVVAPSSSAVPQTPDAGVSAAPEPGFAAALSARLGERYLGVAPRTGDVVKYQQIQRPPDSIRRVVD